MHRFERSEHILFLASVQSLDAIDAWSSPNLVSENLDWQYIFDLAKQHKTVPLLHYFLNKHPSFSVPSEIKNAIDNFVRRQALANVFQTNELIRLLTHFENEGIECIPFKGPALGMHLYGELAYRPFGDLDILIHKEDFQRIKDLLLTLDYTPFRAFTPEKEDAFLNTQMGYEFVRNDERCVIEVHWSLLNKIHAFKLSEKDLWDQKKPMQLQNKSVHRFTDEHLFVYLCAHGSKSFWARLRWITDIAELMTKYAAETDSKKKWESILTIARQSNGIRMVYLGVYLAHKLLNAPAPAPILDDIESDPGIIKLSKRVFKAIFVKPAQQEALLKPVSFHLLLQKNVVHRLPYLSHVARIWALPSKKDKRLVKLPPAFEFLYIAVKPYRLIKRFFSKSKT